MTAQNLTTRAPIAVILADLLVLQSQHKLPAWLSVNVGSLSPTVSVECASYADLLTWHEALDGEDMRCHSRGNDVGDLSGTAFADRLGWTVSLRSFEPGSPTAESLPAETVSALAGIAATADAAVIVAEVTTEYCAWIRGCREVLADPETGLLCPKHDEENAGRIA